jgi:hypothetical protein
VTFAGDQYPVQALTAGAGDPPFGDRVRTGCPHRSSDDPCPGAQETDGRPVSRLERLRDCFPS